MMKKSSSSASHGAKPAIVMVVIQIVFTGVNVLYKMAVFDGMSVKIIVAYRFLFASAFILPIAFFLERKKRPKMTWSILFYGFLCGLFGGSLNQNLYLQSLAMTSSTFVAAMLNLVPAITFVLAVFFRIEKLNIRTREGIAKVMGTIVGIGGAMFLTFYKGIEIDIWSTHIDLLHHGQTKDGHVASFTRNGHSHILGSLLAMGSCISYSLWLIVESKMTKIYPCHYSSTGVMCMMGSIQAVIFAACMERDVTQWKLGFNIRLLTVAYTGIVASGGMVTLISWCVERRGPLYVSIFSPLMLILVAIVGSLCLNEPLHLGSVVGAVLIICGLYLVLWGKSREKKKIVQLTPSESLEEPTGLMEVVVLTTPKEKNGTEIQQSQCQH